MSGGRTTLSGVMCKVGIVRTERQVRHLLSRYLDEESKVGYAQRAAASANFKGTHAEFMAKVATGELPLRRGIDTVENTLLPRLTIHGHIGREVFLRRKSDEPEAEEDIRNLADYWAESTTGLWRKAHHLVFAMNPKRAESLRVAGVAAESALLPAICDTLQSYEARFLNGAALGFVVGVHKDRKLHPHGHVLVHPKDSRGAMFNLSPMSSNTSLFEGEHVRVDYQGFLQMVFNDQLTERCREPNRTFSFPSKDLMVRDNLLLEMAAFDGAEKAMAAYPSSDMQELATSERARLVASPDLARQLESTRRDVVRRVEGMAAPTGLRSLIEIVCATGTDVVAGAKAGGPVLAKFAEFSAAWEATETPLLAGLEEPWPTPGQFQSHAGFSEVPSFDAAAYTNALAKYNAAQVNSDVHSERGAAVRLDGVIDSLISQDRNFYLLTSDLLVQTAAFDGRVPTFLAQPVTTTPTPGSVSTVAIATQEVSAAVRGRAKLESDANSAFPRVMANRYLAPYWSKMRDSLPDLSTMAPGDALALPEDAFEVDSSLVPPVEIPLDAPELAEPSTEDVSIEADDILSGRDLDPSARLLAIMAQAETDPVAARHSREELAAIVADIRNPSRNVLRPARGLQAPKPATPSAPSKTPNFGGL